MDKFDTVKAIEYRRVRKIAKSIEVLVALALISWSSTRLPFAVKYSIEFSAYLFNPHVVFLIGNFIVAALYVLSRHFDVAESDSSSGAGIVYQKWRTNDLSNNSVAEAAAAIYDDELSLPASVKEEEERSAEEKQIVCFEKSAMKTECEAAAVAIEKARKQIERFQRSQSEISLKPPLCKELRRSRTEIRRPVNNGAFERLSNEEFRLTVEAFIEKRKIFLKSQKLAE